MKENSMRNGMKSTWCKHKFCYIQFWLVAELKWKEVYKDSINRYYLNWKQNKNQSIHLIVLVEDLKNCVNVRFRKEKHKKWRMYDWIKNNGKIP